MPSLFARVFTSLESRGTQSSKAPHLPLLNEFSTSLSGYLASNSQMQKKKALIRWYKSIPELTAMVNKVARDICAHMHFEAISPGGSGRNRILQANKFAAEVQLRKTIESQVVDALVTGEGFGWIGKISKVQIQSAAKSILSRSTFIETKEQSKIAEDLVKEIMETKVEYGLPTDVLAIDEDILKPRKYRYIPSSTIEIIYDEYDVIEFRHSVAIYDPVIFKPDEIVHYTFMKRDGKVNGFSPVESIVVQLELLRQMWQNLMSIHKNGGSPDKVFSLEGVNPNSPAYERIKEQLMKYKLVENKHGNMLFTGKLTVTDLQQLDSMQFKDSGLYITGLIAMQWGIPRSSIPYIVGGTNTKDDTGGNSDRGYWETIGYMQQAFAEDINLQLFIPYFGVKLCFENAYVNLDVQRETAMQLKLNNVMAMETILSHSGKTLSDEKKMELLDLTDDDVKEAPLMLAGPGDSTLNAQVSKADQKPVGAQNQANAKRTEQTNTITSRGISPTGVGKESSSLDKFREWPYTF